MIVWANLIRCLLVGLVAVQIAIGLPNIILFVTALLIMGVGRFVGSGLSASMPHTVARDSLVGANALATTSGAIATAAAAATPSPCAGCSATRTAGWPSSPRRCCCSISPPPSSRPGSG